MDEDRRILIDHFEGDLRSEIQNLTRDIGYRAPRWAEMIGRFGGVEAARLLLQSARTHEGFRILWEHDRLDASVEAYVLHPWYEPLFTEDERAAARRRLEDHGFDVDGYLQSLTAPAWARPRA